MLDKTGYWLTGIGALLYPKDSERDQLPFPLFNWPSSNNNKGLKVGIVGNLQPDLFSRVCKYGLKEQPDVIVQVI